MKRAKKAKRTVGTMLPAATPADATSVIVPTLAPRNPFVAHAHRRKAGAHGGARTRRLAEKRELKKLLEE